MVLEARLRVESATVRAWAAESSERWMTEIAAAFIGTVQIAYGVWIAAGGVEDPSPILRRCFAALRDL
jgi:hypothetical protein